MRNQMLMNKKTMGKNNHYLVCRRRFFSGLSPVKIFTAQSTAEAFAATNKRYVVLKQAVDGELESITDKDDE